MKPRVDCVLACIIVGSISLIIKYYLERTVFLLLNNYLEFSTRISHHKINFGISLLDTITRGRFLRV